MRAPRVPRKRRAQATPTRSVSEGEGLAHQAGFSGLGCLFYRSCMLSNFQLSAPRSLLPAPNSQLNCKDLPKILFTFTCSAGNG
jgi:hypothetical protein